MRVWKHGLDEIHEVRDERRDRHVLNVRRGPAQRCCLACTARRAASTTVFPKHKSRTVSPQVDREHAKLALADLRRLARETGEV